MHRSLIFASAFYLVTALFLLGGSWQLLAPRAWAMIGSRDHLGGPCGKAEQGTRKDSWRSRVSR